MPAEFRNEPFTDFTEASNKAAFEKALRAVAAKKGGEHPLVIGGERFILPDKIRSINPAMKTEVLGTFQAATPELAAKAVDVALTAFATWSKVPAAKRAQYLFDAAAVLRERKHEFSAAMVYEVGKSWAEADADTAEAIDFMEFYGREMIRYAADQPLTKLAGEQNELVYLPLGVGVVIPPWNFPLAIMVGMSTAGIVAGNTIVLKPSSDTPWIAWMFFEVMEQVGLPPGVLNFVTGSGGTVGNALVGHPKVRFVSFTGSKETGLHINRLAAENQPGQIWIKRVVAEMGGKDGMIIDRETNLDAAAAAVSAAAFGFQGQKCSACSRVIVDAAVYDDFIAKLLPNVKALSVGPTDNPANTVGPVASQSAYRSIMNYIGIGKGEGRLLAGGEGSDADGFFIQPTVIADVAPTARIALEEIFGPVLAVIKANDFDQAMSIANNTEFGLTGAIFSDNEDKLARAREEFHVGNLYLNRKCTGALVGVHPFGGFNMSGTDSKAGGRDYLLLFLQAKCISRKVG